MMAISNAIRFGTVNPEYAEYPLYFSMALWFRFTPEQVRKMTEDEIFSLQEGIRHHGKDWLGAGAWHK